MGCAEASRYYGMRLQQEKVQSALGHSQPSQKRLSFVYAPGSACTQLYVCSGSGAIFQVVWDIPAGAQSRPGGQ